MDGPVPGVRRLIEADEGRLIANRTQFSAEWRIYDSVPALTDTAPPALHAASPSVSPCKCIR